MSLRNLMYFSCHTNIWLIKTKGNIKKENTVLKHCIKKSLFLFESLQFLRRIDIYFCLEHPNSIFCTNKQKFHFWDLKRWMSNLMPLPRIFRAHLPFWKHERHPDWKVWYSDNPASGLISSRGWLMNGYEPSVLYLLFLRTALNPALCICHCWT